MTRSADRDAVAELYAASYSRLAGLVALVAGGRAEAEECVQEAFIRLLGRWPHVSRLDSPEAWVRTGLSRARAALAGLLRKEARRNPRERQTASSSPERCPWSVGRYTPGRTVRLGRCGSRQPTARRRTPTRPPTGGSPSLSPRGSTSSREARRISGRSIR